MMLGGAVDQDTGARPKPNASLEPDEGRACRGVSVVPVSDRERIAAQETGATLLEARRYARCC